MYPVIHEVAFVKAHKPTMLAASLQVYTIPTMVFTGSERLALNLHNTNNSSNYSP